MERDKLSRQKGQTDYQGKTGRETVRAKGTDSKRDRVTIKEKGQTDYQG